MNSTNRFANRLLLLLAGLIVLGLGVIAIALATSTAFAEGWEDTAPEAQAAVETWLQATAIGSSNPSWILIGALALLLLAIVLLVVFILRQGRGHTDRLIESRTEDEGTTIIDAGVAADVLGEALSQRPEFITSHVSAYTVRRTPVLGVTVTCRRGASPRAASDIVNNALGGLNELIGAEIPALVQISGGFRTRLTAPQRLGTPAPGGADPHRPQQSTTTREETSSWDSSVSSSSA